MFLLYVDINDDINKQSLKTNSWKISRATQNKQTNVYMILKQNVVWEI
jgi:hypothetical protein